MHGTLGRAVVGPQVTDGRKVTRFGQMTDVVQPAWPDPDSPRMPMSTLLLARFAQERGLEATQALAGSGLTVGGLESPDGVSTSAQEVRVIENLVAAAGPGSTWGLDAGQRYHLTTFGIWGFALISAQTVGEAVDVGLRFIDLTSALTAPRSDVDEGNLRIVYHDPPYHPEIARFIVQRDLAITQSVLQEVLGREARFLRVTFTHDADPEAVERYAAVFGFEPEFGAERNSLVFGPALIGERLPQADEHTTALAQAQCRELIEQFRARSGLAGQVRDLVVGRLREPPTVVAVGAALGFSERTLRRRLAAEGTSLRALVDEVRAALAAEFLESGSLTVAEIASRLGYLEVSSFSQAFRRWHGVSAREYRGRVATAGPAG